VLCALLQYERDSFISKVEGVDEEAARRAFVPSGTSLLWLTQHVAQAEQSWVIRRFAGREVPRDLAGQSPSLGEAIDAYRRTARLVDEIVATSDLDALCHDAEPPVSLRWIVAHLLEEISRHAGHADILRELIDGATGR